MKPYKNFDVQLDSRGIVTVTLDVPNRPMNVLTAEVLSELDQIVQELESSENIQLVLFQSNKESGFLSGADVEALQNFATTTEALRAIETGQTLFQRIEWLPMPTVAVIHGPCLGGGLELALACKFRIARDNSSTKIGLPEIKLGLIPGWGGTQRLPKQVGLTNALSMILTGKHLSSKEAHAAGLLHRSISPDHWQLGIQDFVDDVLAGHVEDTQRCRSFWKRWMESTQIGQRLIFRMTSRSIANKTKHYPALRSALKAVQKGMKPGPDGFRCEKDEFVNLLATPTCRNLIGLFFAQQKARKLSTWASEAKHSAHDTPIRRVGMIGAGAMGAGIGQLAAVRGFEVVFKEVDAASSEAGRRRVEKLVDDLAKRKSWTADERADLLNRISFSCDEQPLANCDLVIEAVVERMDIKQHVFRMLDSVAPSNGLLTTNTSSLSVSEMASVTSRPHQVAGLHFFNPVHRMELVEVVRGSQTDAATLSRLVGFVKALGKTPVVTADAPGFLVNRVLFPYLGEAVLMVGEGCEVDELDRQVRRFGMPMGPLQLLDQVGIDVAYHVADSLAGTLPGVEPVARMLHAMVEQDQLGKKSGIGFYHYRRGKRGSVATLPWSMLSESKPEPVEFLDDSMTALQRRVLYPMLAEAIRCHENSIVEQPWAIDLAIVLGTGFAPHRGGPLHWVDSMGSKVFAHNLKAFHDHYGERFSVPTELIEMFSTGENYFGQSATSQIQTTSSM
ncbi:MAG: 3-hydroxyacyl-CoA dehydrogenase NAD-binding domain-containing protein [Planctomycetota bacterium]